MFARLPFHGRPAELTGASLMASSSRRRPPSEIRRAKNGLSRAMVCRSLADASPIQRIAPQRTRTRSAKTALTRPICCGMPRCRTISPGENFAVFMVSTPGTWVPGSVPSSAIGRSVSRRFSRTRRSTAAVQSMSRCRILTNQHHATAPRRGHATGGPHHWRFVRQLIRARERCRCCSPGPSG